MCRTVHAVISTIICGIQMLVRVFMTTILMLENLCRMFLQTFYNFMSFILQVISLVPICLVFLMTSRLKCFMCGGGGPCPVNRGGACDCLMSLFAVIIITLIFRATGLLDKIFWGIGYVKATPKITRFSPTVGELTECSRNDTDTEYVFYKIEESTLEMYDDETTTPTEEEEEETTPTTEPMLMKFEEDTTTGTTVQRYLMMRAVDDVSTDTENYANVDIFHTTIESKKRNRGRG